MENLCKQSTQKLLLKKKCSEVKELINVTTFQEKLSQFDVSFFWYAAWIATIMFIGWGGGGVNPPKYLTPWKIRGKFSYEKALKCILILIICTKLVKITLFNTLYFFFYLIAIYVHRNCPNDHFGGITVFKLGMDILVMLQVL